MHGDEAAADVLERFDRLVRSTLVAHRGTLVKQIGDAFMLTFPDPGDATRFAVSLAEEAARLERFPALRVGIHAGPVLYRVGDYVGNTVNIASRIAAAATPGEVVLTEPVAEAARGAGIEVAPAGVRVLRGIEDPLPLFRVAREGERAAKDPVCGMRVLDSASPRLAWHGAEHAFCSEECLRRFVASPERYAAAGR